MGVGRLQPELRRAADDRWHPGRSARAAARADGRCGGVRAGFLARRPGAQYHRADCRTRAGGHRRGHAAARQPGADPRDLGRPARARPCHRRVGRDQWRGAGHRPDAGRLADPDGGLAQRVSADRAHRPGGAAVGAARHPRVARCAGAARRSAGAVVRRPRAGRAGGGRHRAPSAAARRGGGTAGCAVVRARRTACGNGRDDSAAAVAQRTAGRGERRGRGDDLRYVRRAVPAAAELAARKRARRHRRGTGAAADVAGLRCAVAPLRAVERALRHAAADGGRHGADRRGHRRAGVFTRGTKPVAGRNRPVAHRRGHGAEHRPGAGQRRGGGGARPRRHRLGHDQHRTHGRRHAGRGRAGQRVRGGRQSARRLHAGDGSRRRRGVRGRGAGVAKVR